MQGYSHEHWARDNTGHGSVTAEGRQKAHKLLLRFLRAHLEQPAMHASLSTQWPTGPARSGTHAWHQCPCSQAAPNAISVADTSCIRIVHPSKFKHGVLHKTKLISVCVCVCVDEEQCSLPGSCLIGLVLATVKNIYTGCRLWRVYTYIHTYIHTYTIMCNSYRTLCTP